ncbi:MAG: type II toxin-antitoxin system RelE/ParE family toxin [Prevotellaceae bacterium]|jgi:mRNA interferase RelE/StbE|nr:type II toxin-antitoxin system RelE/ParE family toxin [Prevotellaceae bacterium]
MYKVIFNKSAKKDLEKVSSIYLISITLHIKSLSENPRPSGCTKLSGFKGLYRIRVGVYRIIYTIEDDILTVEVIKIDHRSSVYR